MCYKQQVVALSCKRLSWPETIFTTTTTIIINYASKRWLAHELARMIYNTRDLVQGSLEQNALSSSISVVPLMTTMTNVVQTQSHLSLVCKLKHVQLNWWRDIVTLRRCLAQSAPSQMLIVLLPSHKIQFSSSNLNRTSKLGRDSTSTQIQSQRINEHMVLRNDFLFSVRCDYQWSFLGLRSSYEPSLYVSR